MTAKPEKTSPELDKKVREALVRARIDMLLTQPFYGNLALNLKLVDGSGWVPTAGTDGRYLYYNAKFVADLSKEELIFLVGHEVAHCVYDHMERRGSRHPQLWNMAADHVINLELGEQNVGKIIERKDLKICYDKKYSAMGSEQVYELLAEEMEKQGDKFEMTEFDVHIDPNAPQGEDDGTGFYAPFPMTDAEKRKLKDEIRAATIEAAKAAGAGATPAGVRRMVKDLLDPQMDWREIIQAAVQSQVRSDFTFHRPSRKNFSNTGAIMPGMEFDDMIEVHCAIDTSGSVSEKMLREFLSEVKGIMLQFSDFKIKVWCFDTKTYTVHDYTPDNVDDIDEFPMEGGGGTMFECNWELMIENEWEPHQFLMMTDGYPCGSWGTEEYCDTIFLINGDSNHSITAPFGVTCYYEEGNENN